MVVRKSKGEEYIRESREPWRKPTNPILGFGLLLVAGIIFLCGAFSDHAAPKGLLRAILYALLGHQGTAIIFAIASAYFLTIALEIGLGIYWLRHADGAP